MMRAKVAYRPDDRTWVATLWLTDVRGDLFHFGARHFSTWAAAFQWAFWRITRNA